MMYNTLLCLESQTFVGFASGSTTEEFDHLDLGNISQRLGRKLHLNPSTQTFIADPEADSLLTRKYRQPFVVPAKV